MGQKLVYIQFEEGSATSLWEPAYNPVYCIEVASEGENSWVEITEYYPELAAGSITLPVDLRTKHQITDAVVKDLIQKNQSLAIMVKDTISQWRIRFKEETLTDGQFEILQSGSF